MTLGAKPRRAAATPWATRFGQLDHFDRPGPVGQAADEAALLQRRDQPVDAGFGPQIERVLHLVEGGRHARLFQPLVNEAQEVRIVYASTSVALPRNEATTTG